MTLLVAMLLAASPATIRAEVLRDDGATKRTIADGYVSFVQDDLAIDCDRLIADRTTDTVIASGRVAARILGKDPVAIVGESVVFRLENDRVSEVLLYDAQATSLRGATREGLLAARTAAELNMVGEPTALFTAKKLTRKGETWKATELSFVPCDCDMRKPNWRITAPRGTVNWDTKRASLVSSVVRVKNVPIFWFPWISLPLKNRATGLLFPKVTFSALNGFGLELPVFVTLGRSMDLTLTPGYYFGNATPGIYGVKGPRLGVEFRYAISERASGRIATALMHDFNPVRDPLNPGLVGKEARGIRGEFVLQHTQDFNYGFGARADIKLYSDGYYNRDFITEVIASATTYQRSTASVFQKGNNHLLTVDLVYRQDLRGGYNLLGTARNFTGRTAPTYGGNTLARLPAVTLTVPNVILRGPLSFAFEAEYVRLAPLYGVSGDEGAGALEGNRYVNGQWIPWGCAAARLFGIYGDGCTVPIDRTGVGDRIWQPGEREARDRFVAFPKLRVAGVIGGWLSASASAGYRQALWIGEASKTFTHRGTPYLDLSLETSPSRFFGAWRHTITPSLRFRSLAWDIGNGAVVPYDAIDMAAPQERGPRLQGVAEVRQRLQNLRRGVTLGLDIGQYIDFLPQNSTTPTVGETFLLARYEQGPGRLRLLFRIDPLQALVTRVSASGAVDIGKGRYLMVFYDRALAEGTDRSRAPMDLLFGNRVTESNVPYAEALTVSAGWGFGIFALRYSIGLYNRDFAPSWTQPVDSRLAFTQHSLTLGFTPACHCWQVDVSLRQGMDWSVPGGRLLLPDVGLSVSIAGFGAFGTGTALR